MVSRYAAEVGAQPRADARACGRRRRAPARDHPRSRVPGRRPGSSRSRSSVHLSGSPSLIAAAATAAISAAITPLLPNAPPTSGTITRMRSSSRPRMWASCARGRCGSWAEHHDRQQVASPGRARRDSRASRSGPRPGAAARNDPRTTWRGGAEGALDVPTPPRPAHQLDLATSAASTTAGRAS